MPERGRSKHPANDQDSGVQRRSEMREERTTERPGSPGNRRLERRYAVECEVTLESQHNFYVGLVQNFSGTGAGVFVATHALRPLGEQLALSIRIGESGELVTGTAEVRWVREYSETSDAPPGMGLAFVQLDEGHRARIERFLRGREPLFYDDDR